MNASVLRDKETGEFACIVDGVVLCKGKSGPMVSRVYDMAEAVNTAIGADKVPQVTTEGRGPARRFGVVWGDAVIASGMNATGAYRILDSLEALYGPEEVAMPEVLAPNASELGLMVPGTEQ